MGFAPQSLNHDHFVSCVLLGDWFAKLPRGVTIITEQELLSLDLTGVAPGLQNDKGRRPDGLQRFGFAKSDVSTTLIRNSQGTAQNYCDFKMTSSMVK